MTERVPQDDWVDQDLLTRDEAARRLTEEIDAVAARLPSTEGSEHELLSRRLAAMKDAHEAMTAR